MLATIYRSWAARCFVGFLAFIVLGYFSNAVSLAGCERQCESTMNDRLARTPQIMPGRTARSEPATFTFPWIVEVRYWCAVSMKGGEGGTKYYVSLFGLAIPIRNRVELQS